MAARKTIPGPVTDAPTIIGKGKGAYVVIPLAEFDRMREALDDALDLAALQAARRENAGKPSKPWEQVKRELGIAEYRKPKKRHKAA